MPNVITLPPHPNWVGLKQLGDHSSGRKAVGTADAYAAIISLGCKICTI
jgi:hypothetical protein